MVGGMTLGLTWFAMLFGSGVGIPVGMPPAPQEAFMYNVAPEDCLYFTTWASMADIDPTSDNHTERLMAEKQVQSLVIKAEAAFRKFAEAQGGRRDDSEQIFTEAMPDVSRTILTRATTVFIDGFEMRGEYPHFSGGLVVSLGDNEDKIRRHMEAIGKALGEENEFTSVEIAGTMFTQMAIPEGENLLTWGIHEGRLLFGVGEGAVQEMIERGGTDAPKWLDDMKEDLKVERISSVSYVNLKEIIAELRRQFGDGDAAFIFAKLDDLGLGAFNSYRTVSGFEDGGIVDRSALDVEGKRRGVLSAIGNSKLKARNLEKLPRDPLLALALQIDLKMIYDMIHDDPSMIGAPDGAFDKMIEGAEDVISADFRDDLIGSLGDAIYLYTAPNDGGFLTGWTLAIDVDQSMTLDQIMQRIIGFAKASLMVGGADELQIKTQTVSGNDVHYLVFRDSFIPFSFSFSLVNDQLLFSLYPQAIKGHVARQKNPAGFAQNEVVASALAKQAKGNLTAIGYVDMPELVRQFYPFLVGLSSQLVYADEVKEMGISPADIPPVEVIAKHLRPAMTMTYATDNEYRSTSRHVLPTGTIGANAPAMVALMLPAVSSARTAARRTVSANNLKQLALGLHNYHDTFRGMPPAYSTDKDGKPLLSWRVHILPFMEQQVLYEEFHLDEPWDSEHNKALIEKMPIYLQSPAARAEAGKTVYLGMAGDNCAFGPESITDKAALERPVGHSLANFTDGTSNTIWIVEANAENAVTWTKPEDFEAPEMNPLGRLLGTWKNGFQVSWADGSVEFLNDDVDPEDLQNMFKMNDGNVIRR